MRDPLALAFSLVADRAWRLAFALTFHAPDAEDLLQQTLLVAARKRSRIPSDDPWPWFAAVMHREVRNLRRKNLRHITAALQEASMADAHHGPPDAAARNELRQQLRNALQQLPEDERDALVAGYIGGLTQKQAAKALGLPLGTYKKRVREGLSSLRRRMKVEGAQATAMLPLIPIPAPPPGWEAALIQSVAHIAPGAIVGGIAMKKIAIAAASVLAIAILGTWAGKTVLFPETPEHPHRNTPVAQAPDTTPEEPDNPETETTKGRGSSASSDATPRANDEEAGVDPRPADVHAPVEDLPDTEPDPAGTHRAVIAGRVVDSAGRGIEGASVSAGGAKLETPAGGAFRLEVEWGSAETHALRLRASAPGMTSVAGRELQLTPGASIQGITLVLHTGATVYGKATWEGGSEPAAGITVEAVHGDRTDTKGDVDLNLAERTTVTNDKGEYRVEGLPPGQWFIRGKNAESRALVVEEHRERTPQHSQAEFIRVKEGEEKGPVNLNIPRQMRLIWTLKAPAEGRVFASVVQSGMDRLPSYGGWGVGINPDENGVYMLDWLTTKHTQLRIKADGFAETFFALKPKLGEDLDLGELTLDRGQTVRGRVEDSSGRGISGATLYLKTDIDMPFVRPDGDDGKAKIAEAVSDDNGRFEMPGLAAGGYVLTCEHADFATEKVQVGIRKGADPPPMTVVMKEAGVIFGVVSAPRTPVESEWPDPEGVRAISMTEPRVVEMVDIHPGYAGFLGKKGPLFTPLEEGGGYELRGMPPGRWMVVAYRQGNVDFRMDVTVEPGRRTRVDFDFSTRTGSIAGKVSINGRAAPGMEFIVIGQTGRITRATPRLKTDDDGAYRFLNILPGKWYVLTQPEAVRMDAEVLTARQVEVTPGGEVTLNIDIEETGVTLNGHVTLGGAPHYTRATFIPGFAGGKEKQADIAKDGTFTRTGLEPGLWHVWFRGGNLLELSVAYATIEITETSSEPWKLNFAKAGVTVTCGLETLTAGTRLDGWFIGGGPETNASRISLPLSAGGPTVFANLVPGRYRFVLEVAGYAPVVKEVDVSGATEVDLTPAAEGAGVTVTFGAAGGFTPEELKNWQYARMWIEQAGYTTSKKLVAVRENYDAQTKFESLQPGPATLYFRGDAFEPQTVQITLEAGATKELTLTPHKGARAILNAGAALTAPQVTVTNAAGQPVEISETLLNDARALADGKLQLGPLVAGTYRATIKGEGEPVQVDFTINRSQQLEVAMPGGE